MDDAGARVCAAEWSDTNITQSDIKSLAREADAQISACKSLRELEELRVRYLGKKGQLTRKLKSIGDAPLAERSTRGQILNVLKKRLQENIAARRAVLEEAARTDALKRDVVDVGLPGRFATLGGLHPLTHTLAEMQDIFTRIGFDIADGPELEDDFHNFEALNMPSGHAARTMHDTFYAANGLLLRTHTSPVQIRYMKKQKPPLRVIAPGRVYRRDSDITHTPMFHQLEGLVVAEQVSFADLKAILVYFVRRFFNAELRVRFRPSYFPFTEPSAEVDISCVFCQGDAKDNAHPRDATMHRIPAPPANQSGCRVCGSSGWVEVLGCGMVHPHVLKNVDIDAEAYSGYAFGMGVERFAMLRYGIDDLRVFFDNDLAFLRQFR